MIGAIAIGIAMLGGEGLNVSFMVGLAFAVAASANFPALLLALTLAAVQHHRRDHRRAGRRDQLGRARDHQPDGVAGAGLRGRAVLVVRPRQPGDHQHPARVHRLLGRHDAGARAARRSAVRRAAACARRRASGAEIGTGLTLTGRGDEGGRPRRSARRRRVG